MEGTVIGIMDKKKVLFLCSGSGGSMIFINLATNILNSPFVVVGVLADRECGSIEYAKCEGLYAKVFKPWRELTAEVIKCIRDINPDIVVTNISKILPSEILKCCEAKFINLHWSLLPAFGGVIGFKTLELAKQNNSKIIGATCHYVTEELDGGTIIAQGALPVDWGDSHDDISRSVFRTACKVLLNAMYEILEISDKQFTSSDGYLYSPSLLYDDSFINNDFWEKTIYANGKNN